jgi:hypothetical protein
MYNKNSRKGVFCFVAGSSADMLKEVFPHRVPVFGEAGMD